MASKKTKLTLKELKKRFPKAYAKHVENVLEWMEDEGSLTFEVDEEKSELTSDGHFPGEEYGGDIKLLWDGKAWVEDESDDEEDEEQEDDGE